MTKALVAVMLVTGLGLAPDMSVGQENWGTLAEVDKNEVVSEAADKFDGAVEEREGFA